MASSAKDSSRSKKDRDNKSRKNKNPDPKDEKLSDLEALKHFDIFYTQPPPGLVKEEKDNPEDCIPNLPENQSAREFLAKAPTKGLWMPLGKEVKVMKCWRCKAYGHRTGDRECPMFLSGNTEIEKFRFSHEDPMHNFIAETKKKEKEGRIQQLQALLESSTSESSSSSSSSSEEEKSRKRKKKSKKRHKSKHKKRKKK